MCNDDIAPATHLVNIMSEYVFVCFVLGFVAQDVACGSSKDTQAEHKPLNLASFCNLKNLAKLKLRSVSGNLRLENLSQSLTNFSQSLRILVSLNIISQIFNGILFKTQFCFNFFYSCVFNAL